MLFFSTEEKKTHKEPAKRKRCLSGDNVKIEKKKKKLFHLEVEAKQKRERMRNLVHGKLEYIYRIPMYAIRAHSTGIIDMLFILLLLF